MNAKYQRAVNRFNIIARQTAFVRHAAVEINRPEKFFKRRRLQYYFAFTVGNDAGAVEDYSIVSAYQIYKHDWEVCHLRSMRNHRAALAHLPFIKRRGIDGDQYLCAQVDQIVRRVVRIQSVLPKRFVVPKVFADSHAKFAVVHRK